MDAPSAAAAAARHHVLIATTRGPVAVRGLWRERAPGVRSDMLRHEQSHRQTGVSADYAAFPATVGRILAGHFGLAPEPLALMLEVDGEIDTGSSWQLGAFAAQALEQQGRLALVAEQATHVLCLGGRINTSSLTVAAVEDVGAKLDAARPVLEAHLARGRAVVLILPAQALPLVEPAALPAGVETVGIERLAELMALLGPAPARRPAWPLLPALLLATLTAASVPLAPAEAPVRLRLLGVLPAAAGCDGVRLPLPPRDGPLAAAGLCALELVVEPLGGPAQVRLELEAGGEAVTALPPALTGHGPLMAPATARLPLDGARLPLALVIRLRAGSGAPLLLRPLLVP